MRGREEAVRIYTLPLDLLPDNTSSYSDLVEKHEALKAALAVYDSETARKLLEQLRQDPRYPEGLAWYLEIILDTPAPRSRQREEGTVEV